MKSKTKRRIEIFLNIERACVIFWLICCTPAILFDVPWRNIWWSFLLIQGIPLVVVLPPNIIFDDDKEDKSEQSIDKLNSPAVYHNLMIPIPRDENQDN